MERRPAFSSHLVKRVKSSPDVLRRSAGTNSFLFFAARVHLSAMVPIAYRASATARTFIRTLPFPVDQRPQVGHPPARNASSCTSDGTCLNSDLATRRLATKKI